MDSQTALDTANQPHQQASSISYTAEEVYQLVQTQGFALLDKAIDAQCFRVMGKYQN